MAKVNFDKLSKTEQQVQIAKDILAQVRTKRITPKNSIWTSFKFRSSQGEKEIKDKIANKPCEACALGSMFICAIDRADALKIKDLGDYKEWVRINQFDHKTIRLDIHDIRKYLIRFFDEQTIIAVEVAFEEGEGGFSNCDWEGSAQSYKRAINFCKGKTPKAKLIAIAKNLIEHNGKFVP